MAGKSTSVSLFRLKGDFDIGVELAVELLQGSK